MSRPLVVLRPEPGNAATVARIVAAGGHAIRLPLFTVRPLAWIPVPAAEHDALILTSANAVRHAGPALAAYRTLPVYAVGSATAAAAAAAGLAVVAVGEDDAAALAARAAADGVHRALHLTGRHRTQAVLAPVTRSIAVYASAADPLPAPALVPLAGAVALLHSPRAGARLAALVPARGTTRADIAVAAISPAALRAAGAGWARMIVATAPTDALLVAAGLSLAD